MTSGATCEPLDNRGVVRDVREHTSAQQFPHAQLTVQLVPTRSGSSLSDADVVFSTLREILREHAGRGTFAVTTDTASRFCLEAPIGPATLAAWKGKPRRPTIPVAWVERGKSNVSYHLMGLADNAPVLARFSPQLKARLHGKTCLNFREPDAELFAELQSVTAETIGALQRAGFIAS